MMDQPNLLTWIKRYARARLLLAMRSIERHAESLHEWLRTKRQEQRIRLDTRLRQQRADLLIASMPDTAAALRMLGNVRGRLIALGWQDTTSFPHDGSPFEVVLYASASIHTAAYLGEWPTGEIDITTLSSLGKDVTPFGLWRVVKADSAEVAV